MHTLKVLKYSFFDLIRSRWSIIYFLFFFAASALIQYMSPEPSKVISSLLNITLYLTPLIGTLFGIINYYNSREFIELLLSQPVKRSNVFLGLYFGLGGSLALSFLLGVLLPGIIFSSAFFSFLADISTLILAGVLLTFTFTGIAFLIGIKNENRLKGFGTAILVWLFMAFIYDGILLILLLVFEAYPLEKMAIALSILNPIDLSRILIMLKLDISAMMGYTGAVFNKFFGTYLGITVSIITLLVWCAWPLVMIIITGKKKDF